MSEEDVDALAERLEAAETTLAEATSEAEYTELEGMLSDIESDLESAERSEDSDEADADPAADLAEELSGLRERLDAERGPYAENVVTVLEGAAATVAETRWSDTGASSVVAATETFLETITAHLEDDVTLDGETTSAAVDAVETVADGVGQRDLDPDEDADTITALLEAAEALESDLEDAEAWSDLSVRQQLEAEGFYDVLEHYKDFPPELSALKEWERRGRVDMIALAYDNLDSEFMEDHCLEAFKRMGDPAAIDTIESLIDRREADAIEIAGKTGSERPVETLLEYVGEDGDPTLQLVTIRALGEIGAESAVQPIADQLHADDERVRSRAARSLGLIGDTRAIDPLSDVLATDDRDDVRASAAWALNQIGTRRARAHLDDYEDDGAYLVESEAAKAI